MDAFRKISGLLHDLLPSFQESIDKVLVARSQGYWNDYVLKKLDPQEQRYWKHNGICSVEDIDLQGVLKIVIANYDLFEESCGRHFTTGNLRELRKVRNVYAHDSGAVPAKIALGQLPIIRDFSRWLGVSADKLALVDKAGKELQNADSPRPIKIVVAKQQASSESVPMTEYAMTQKAAESITRLAKEKGLDFGKIIVQSIQGDGDFALTKRQKSLYSLDSGKGYSAVLFNTPNDDYIVIDVVSDGEAQFWFDNHSVNYDSETGHIMVSRVCLSSGKHINVVEWSNDLPEDTAVDGDIELPDHGGGSIDYKSQLSKSIPLSKTLKNNPARRSAICLLDKDLCKKLYDGTLENWQVYLHPEQLKAVMMDSDGPMMIKGPAGTGKTVVLVHRAKWLLENVFTTNERILITTFNKSLEFTIEQMLKSICGQEQLNRIEVVYFDQWLLKAWKKMGGSKILYKDSDVSDTKKNLFRLNLAINRAKGLIDIERTDEFIEREYDYIVQEYKLRDEASYLAAVRPKKFGVIRQDERKKLWKIFQDVNGDPFALDVKPVGTSTRMRVINHVAKAIEAHQFGIADKYAAVLVDESQDMGAAEYRLFGALTGNIAGHESPNSLVFAGDGHQRIYGRMGSLISSGINVRGGRTVLLKKCYRSSKALKRYAEKFLDGVSIKDMDDGDDTFADSEAIDDGIEPVECFNAIRNYDAMHDAMAKQIKGWMSVGSKHFSDYAILLREGNWKWDKTWRLRKTAKNQSRHRRPGIDAD